MLESYSYNCYLNVCVPVDVPRLFIWVWLVALVCIIILYLMLVLIKRLYEIVIIMKNLGY